MASRSHWNLQGASLNGKTSLFDHIGERPTETKGECTHLHMDEDIIDYKHNLCYIEAIPWVFERRKQRRREYAQPGR